MVGKLYTNHLLDKLSTWLCAQKVWGPQQIGFRLDRSTLHHCIMLTHLVQQYGGAGGAELFSILKEALSQYAEVYHGANWIRFSRTKEATLSYLQLYSLTSCQMCYSGQVDLASEHCPPPHQRVKTKMSIGFLLVQSLYE